MERNSKSNIARNVCALRKIKNLAREDLSLLLGFENSYISKLEKEKINITINKLDKIASFFDVDTYTLLKNNNL